jgi:hypothetical protein
VELLKAAARQPPGRWQGELDLGLDTAAAGGPAAGHLVADGLPAGRAGGSRCGASVLSHGQPAAAGLCQGLLEGEAVGGVRGARPAGNRRDQVIYYQYRHDRARRHHPYRQPGTGGQGRVTGRAEGLHHQPGCLPDDTPITRTSCSPPWPSAAGSKHRRDGPSGSSSAPPAPTASSKSRRDLQEALTKISNASPGAR